MRTMTGTRFNSTASSVTATRGAATGAKRLGVLGTAALFGITAMTAFAPEARADEVNPKGKGIVGGALLGAEVITITEALAGVKPGWAYWVGAGVGAVGGGIAGHFIEQSSADPRVSVLMLAGGISLVIPALVLSLNATRYQPAETTSEDHAPTTNGPTPEPGAVGGSVVIGGSTTTPAAAPAPAAPTAPPPATPGSSGPPSTDAKPGTGPSGALLDLGGGEMRIGVPVPEVRAMYSLQQLKELGVPQQTEYRVSVMHVTF